MSSERQIADLIADHMDQFRADIADRRDVGICCCLECLCGCTELDNGPMRSLRQFIEDDGPAFYGKLQTVWPLG